MTSAGAYQQNDSRLTQLIIDGAELFLGCSRPQAITQIAQRHIVRLHYEMISIESQSVLRRQTHIRNRREGVQKCRETRSVSAEQAMTELIPLLCLAGQYAFFVCHDLLYVRDQSFERADGLAETAHVTNDSFGRGPVEPAFVSVVSSNSTGAEEHRYTVCQRQSRRQAFSSLVYRRKTL